MMAKTIAAISTAMAPGGIGIIRISGPEARQIADRVFRPAGKRSLLTAKGYTALFGAVYTAAGEKLDDCVALVFAAPKSYTGEEVVELSCHGGLYVMKRLLREVLNAGAVAAEPGEFTRRAFLNGKMDLTQAEAVMQLIGANGEQAAKAAVAGNDGALAKKIGNIREEMTDLAAHLSAWADFPDEDIPQVEEGRLKTGLEGAVTSLRALLAGFDTGKLLREGVSTVIVGKPNAGKSTLMNLLAGCERSIVTQYAGTTRDVVEETVNLGGVPLRLADTAGLRETDDPVERIGVAAARDRLKTAQLVLAVFDASLQLDGDDRALMESLPSAYTVAVVNKTDLEGRIELEEIKEHFSHVAFISAASGDGLTSLTKEVSALLDTESFNPADGVLYTERQRADVEQALQSLEEALQALHSGMTLDAVTVCVEAGLEALYSLTGERVSDAVVDEVFSQFCVGK